jgi:hypothetical protein
VRSGTDRIPVTTDFAKVTEVPPCDGFTGVSLLRSPRRFSTYLDAIGIADCVRHAAAGGLAPGMPVIHNGRCVHASPEELNSWLGREWAGEPVQIATETGDLSAELKRRLSYVRKRGTGRPKKKAA